MTVAETPQGYRCRVTYDTGLFERETAERMARHFLELLEAAVEDPGRRLSQLAPQVTPQARPLPGEPPGDRGEPPPTSGADRPGSPPSDQPPGASLRSLTHERGRSLAWLRTAASGRPLFCIHGLGGHVAAFLPLARELRTERPVYGLQALGLDPGETPHERIEDMAAWYVDEIRSIQLAGPYLLCGWSLGGLIALETARQLRDAGHETGLLAMLDTHLRVADFNPAEMTDASVLRWIAPQLQISRRQLQELTPQQQWDLVAERARQSAGLGAGEIRRLADVCKAQLAASARYQPQAYGGRAVLFRVRRVQRRLDPRWKALCPELDVQEVAGDHYSMLRVPHVVVLAEELERSLQGAESLGKMAGVP